MEENKQGAVPEKEELNKEERKRTTGHTWIGDKDEIRPDPMIRTVTRATLTGSGARDGGAAATRLVERERRPYRGFITDEEVKHAEAAAEIDRMSRAEEQAARDRLAQTRIYNGLGSGLDDSEEKSERPAQEAPAEKAPRVRRSVTIRTDDTGKIRRLIALAVVFALLLVFEISYVAMKARTASLPSDTADVKAQTEKVVSENEEIQSKTESIGDYDEVRENRDSWQKIRDSLAE